MQEEKRGITINNNTYNEAASNYPPHFHLPLNTPGISTSQLNNIKLFTAYTIETATIKILSILFIRTLASLINAGKNDKSVRLSIWRVAAN